MNLPDLRVVRGHTPDAVSLLAEPSNSTGAFAAKVRLRASGSRDACAPRLRFASSPCGETNGLGW